MAWKIGDIAERVTENVQPHLWGEVGKRYSVVDIGRSGDILLDISTERRSFANSNSFKKSELKVGDKVRLNPSMPFKYGKGEVSFDEVGEINEVTTGGEIFIDFPRNTLWLGVPKEVILYHGVGLPEITEPVFELDMAGFPHCCTANLISSFGGTGTAFFTDNVSSDNIVKALEVCIDKTLRQGKAMVICTTNDEQKEANKALKEVGFSSSKWAKKENHPETRLRVWYYVVND